MVFKNNKIYYIWLCNTVLNDISFELREVEFQNKIRKRVKQNYKYLKNETKTKIKKNLIFISHFEEVTSQRGIGGFI